MDRKGILAVVVCAVVILFSQKMFFQPTEVNAVTSENKKVEMDSQAVSLEKKQPPLRSSQSAIEIKNIKLNNSEITVSNKADFISQWSLTNYTDEKKKQIDLRTLTQHPEVIQFGSDLQDYIYLNNVSGEISQDGDKTYWSYKDKNIEIKKTYQSYPDQPYVDILFAVKFKANKPNYAFISVVSESFEDDPEGMDRHLTYWTNQEIERVSLQDGLELTQIQTPIKWIAATNRYFAFTLLPQSQALPTGVLQPFGAYGGRFSFVYPVQSTEIQIPLRTYFGPKDLKVLPKIDQSLDNVVDFGMFTFLAYPILSFMNWLFQFVHNYGLAIILLTVIIRILTYPLTLKSMKSMKQMAKVQPQIQKLKEKYKNDKEALNREMLLLMKSKGYNPMAGCFPILIQMPIFFALYRVLYGSVELYQAPFMFWIQDLSLKDPYYVTPVLMSLTMFLQQKLTPNAITDPTQKKMMQLMPLIFGVFMLTLPAGLTLYILTSTVVGIAQQVIINKKLGANDVGTIPARAR